jgi:hypothetical protein
VAHFAFTFISIKTIDESLSIELLEFEENFETGYTACKK